MIQNFEIKQSFHLMQRIKKDNGNLLSDLNKANTLNNIINKIKNAYV